MQTGLNSQIEMMNHFDSSSSSSSHDDFLKQMLSTLPSSSWSLDSSNPNPLWNQPPSLYDQHNNLSAKFRNHHITDNNHLPLLLSSAAAADSALLSIPRDFDSSPNDVVSAGDGSVQAIYNGLSGSLHGTAHASNQTQHFQPLPQGQGQSLGATNQAPNVQPKQRVRARRGQATDPHSIAERLRRERIAERMKALQELVPNANKTDKASMLDEIIDYVKFLQLQVKVLSMSRLGGAAAVAPLVADMSSEVAGDCNGNGGVHPRNLNGNQTSSSNDSLAMTEQQVAKMMEEDMGSAMQYLQGKGLCLMPISLATAISTATCHTRNTLINHADGPSSPGRSVLSVQSATAGNGGADSVVKDTASVSKS